MKQRMDFRLSDKTRQQITALAEHMSTNMTAIVEVAVDRMAKRELRPARQRRDGGTHNKPDASLDTEHLTPLPDETK